MGLLAGAVAGLGQGMIAKAQFDFRAQMAELENAREEALVRLQAKFASENTDKQIKANQDIEAARHEHALQQGAVQETLARTRQAQGDEAEAARQKERLASEEREGRANRKNALDVANVRASAAGGRSSQTPWKTQKAAVSIMEPGKGLVTVDSLIMTKGPHAVAQVSTDRGDVIFVPYQAGAKEKQVVMPKVLATKTSLEKLRADPVNVAPRFFAEFDYVPAAYASYLFPEVTPGPNKDEED